MAKRTGVAIWALAAATALSGCGTTMNVIGYMHGPPDLTPRLSPEALPYGGVIIDTAILVAGGMTYAMNETLPTWKEAAVASLLLLDLPLSAIGDTLTLPLTAYTGLMRLTAETTPPVSASDSRPTIDPGRFD